MVRAVGSRVGSTLGGALGGVFGGVFGGALTGSTISGAAAAGGRTGSGGWSAAPISCTGRAPSATRPPFCGPCGPARLTVITDSGAARCAPIQLAGTSSTAANSTAWPTQRRAEHPAGVLVGRHPPGQHLAHGIHRLSAASSSRLGEDADALDAAGLEAIHRPR